MKVVGTFIITSAAYADPDFVSTFGLLPPAFLPVGNKRLYQVQANLISHLKCRKLLSIPSNFDIHENEVGNISESEGHHPDIIFGWGYAKIKIFTHTIKGLVESDFILAAKIDKIKL